MSNDNNLMGVYIDVLRDTWDAEKQIVAAMPSVIEAASSDQLKNALAEHLEETKNHVTVVERVIRKHNEDPQGEKCNGMEGLLKESKKTISEFEKGPARDSLLIANCQKVEHYEISAYGTLCTYAAQLGFEDDEMELRSVADQESGADSKLTSIATGSVNMAAEEAADRR
jgi:ferritin-like metal-binding protein YciE